jgi:acyl carrier protein
MKEIDQSEFLRAFETAFQQKVSGVTLETAFRELPEWDSLASVMVVAELYADYGVQVSGEELGSCRTLGDLKSLVQDKL